MNRTTSCLLCALFSALLYGVAAADQPAPAADPAKGKAGPGQNVFTKYRCSSCHSVESHGIKKKATSSETEETGSVKPPDLSGVGVERDAAWITKFLQKEEKIEGKLHPKKFRGTAPELQKLTAWLVTLKDEAAAKKMKANEKAAEKAADAKEDATKGSK
jgi:hypothetical protein